MLNEIQFGHHMTRSGLHQVTAKHKDHVVGGLQWHPEHDPEAGISRGEISTVALLPEYQGHGVATEMLNHAKSLSESNPDIPAPQHSASRSPAGSAWAEKTGGRIPENSEPQSSFNEQSTRSLVHNMARA